MKSDNTPMQSTIGAFLQSIMIFTWIVTNRAIVDRFSKKICLLKKYLVPKCFFPGGFESASKRNFYEIHFDS